MLKKNGNPPVVGPLVQKFQTIVVQSGRYVQLQFYHTANKYHTGVKPEGITVSEMRGENEKRAGYGGFLHISPLLCELSVPPRLYDSFVKICEVLMRSITCFNTHSGEDWFSTSHRKTS